MEERPGRGRCAIASVALREGSVVAQFSGPPFAACLLPSAWSNRCARCYVSADRLRGCSKCHRLRYCGVNCQREDWRSHKHECAALGEQTSPIHELSDAPASEILLAGRCLWRRHGASAAEDTEVAPVVAFDAMASGSVTAEDRLR